MKTKTDTQFKEVVEKCKKLFLDKMKDYGPSWGILRLTSVTDQINIKLMRIRQIEELGKQEIADSIKSEYIGTLNYAVIALIILELKKTNTDFQAVTVDQADIFFDKYVKNAKDLLDKKNHDYGEAWRVMRISSITDMMLQKILRLKQIEDNKGKTVASEGIDANYNDIINYSAFALIRLEELEKK